MREYVECLVIANSADDCVFDFDRLESRGDDDYVSSHLRLLCLREDRIDV